MLRATFKSLLSRKARLLLSGIAVILGVTFISGSLVLNASLGKSVESMFTTIFDDVDVQVTATGDGDNVYGPATPIAPEVLDRIETVDGVDKTTGLVQDGTGALRVVGKNGKVPPMMGAPTIGQNWTGADEPLELREGAEPTADDEIVVNQTLIDATGYAVGDDVPLLTLDPEPVEYTIVGIAGYSGDRGSIAGEQSVWFTLDAARAALMKEPDAYTNIMVDATPGTDVDGLRDRIADTLGAEYTVQTGEELAEEQSGAFEELLSFFNYLLLGFGAVALIVSVFLIINTFSIIVAQRTRELALFRAMGAGRGQVTGSVLLEAFVIGLFSSVLGLALGTGVGYLGTVALADAGESLDPSLVVPWSAVIAALAVGVGVTMLAAILPALNASRIPPIAALRDAASTVRPVRVFAIVGGLLLIGGGALLWAGLSGRLGDGDDKLWGVLGAAGLLFIGSAVFTPVLAKPLVSVIGRLLSFSLPGKLGRRNSARNPRRTAITASALMIGIALVTAVGVLLSSAQASMTKYFETAISADIMIGGTQTGPYPPSFNADVLTQTREIDGVEEVAGAYFDSAKRDGEDYYVQATDDLSAFTGMLGDKVVEGDADSFGGNDVALYEQDAKDQGLEIGDTLTVTFSAATTPTTLTVAAIIEAGSEEGTALVSADNADKFGLSSPIQAYVKISDDADQGQIMESINGLLESNPEVAAADISALTDQIGQIFDIILLVVQILLGLAMFIAVIGVVNTLTLSVLERTRELGLLRAVGMTRGQVTRMVTVESIVISVFGSLLGLGIGAGIGVAVQRALSENFVDVLAMPWSTMAFYLVAAIVIGVLAAMIPAYRANRLNVLNAISYE